MNQPIQVRPEAEDDLAEAALWYEAQRLGLGRRFLDEVEAVFAAIAERPLRFPPLHRQTRRALLHRFPYGVYYLAEADRIVVVAVMHARRHPRRWRERT